MIQKIKSSITIQVFIAMAAGILSGLVAPSVMIRFGFIGSMWLNGIKILIIPMILTTIPDEMTKNKLIAMFESLEKLINSMIGIVMKLSPIGIFFLMADSFLFLDLKIVIQINQCIYKNNLNEQKELPMLLMAFLAT